MRFCTKCNICRQFWYGRGDIQWTVNLITGKFKSKCF
jgi:hypothetical protein